MHLESQPCIDGLARWTTFSNTTSSDNLVERDAYPEIVGLSAVASSVVS